MTVPSFPRAVEAASLRGMLLGIAAYSLFALHDALVKGIIIDVPLMQIMLLRSLVVMAGCLAIGRRAMLTALRNSRQAGMTLLRALLTLAAWCMYYPAGQVMQLAEMTTLYYFAPVITIVLAVIFLREALTLARVAAAAIGFFGVVVACNPLGISLSLPTFLVLGAALCWSLGTIVMRSIPKTESALGQVFLFNAVYVVVTGTLAVFTWEALEPRETAIVIAIGLIAGLAQVSLVDAARRAPASVLGTVEYGALVWSFLFGYLFWTEVPAPSVFIGAALIASAGLMLAWSESRRRRDLLGVR